VTISIYSISVETFVPMLTTLSNLLDKGAEHARAKGAEVNALAAARLAPDMFPLSAQVLFSCHQAKECVARLTGQESPVLENKEMSFAEMKALIEAALAHLKSLKASQFDGAEDRQIVMPLQGPIELHANGLQFLRDWTLPNFYFHVVTAYDILRHLGVELGKRDYMGHVSPYIRPRA
jgi:uncharacterized protein